MVQAGRGGGEGHIHTESSKCSVGRLASIRPSQKVYGRGVVPVHACSKQAPRPLSARHAAPIHTPPAWHTPPRPQTGTADRAETRRPTGKWHSAPAHTQELTLHPCPISLSLLPSHTIVVSPQRLHTQAFAARRHERSPALQRSACRRHPATAPGCPVRRPPPLRHERRHGPRAGLGTAAPQGPRRQ